jgi:hypothetical protein
VSHHDFSDNTHPFQDITTIVLALSLALLGSTELLYTVLYPSTFSSCSGHTADQGPSCLTLFGRSGTKLTKVEAVLL